MTANRFGLQRTIPDTIKREVRQRCGFGCVICGKSVVDYEHVEPPFADAVEHRAAAITLLCIQHHGEVTRGFLSKATVASADERPKCRELGFSFGELDPAVTHPVLIFAGNTLRNCAIPIEVHGAPLFLIEEPEQQHGPYRISARFFDGNGQPSLEIYRNEWNAPAEQWDCEFEGGRITVRSAAREIALQVAFLPREGIAIERLNMRVPGYHFRGSRNQLTVTHSRGGMVEMSGNLMDGCRVGLSLN